MATYVHSPSAPDIYHWCINCSKYPSISEGASSARPQDQLCDECRELEAKGTGQT